TGQVIPRHRAIHLVQELLTACLLALTGKFRFRKTQLAHDEQTREGVTDEVYRWAGELFRPSLRKSAASIIRKRSIFPIIVRPPAFGHRIGFVRLPDSLGCRMEKTEIRPIGKLIWRRSRAKGSAPRHTPNANALQCPVCIIGADV